MGKKVETASGVRRLDTSVGSEQALTVARRMHMAAAGGRFKEAAQALSVLQRLLATTSLSVADQRVIAKRLIETQAAAERADQPGFFARSSVPLLVFDLLTVNEKERLAAAIESMSFDRNLETATNYEIPIVDLHADTPMHALALGNVKRTKGQSMVEALLPNSTRTVTMQTFAKQRGGGMQVFTAYEEGFPPAPRLSHKLYTQFISNGLEGANNTPTNQLIAQLIWIHQQVAKHNDRLVLSGPHLAETRTAFLHEDGTPRSNPKHAIHIGIEGARFLSAVDSDADELAAFLAANEMAKPANMPFPTRQQLETLEGRLDYLEQVGVTYIGIVHLYGNEFAGTDFPGLKQAYHTSHGTTGLTDKGRDLVTQMDKRGILVDLAHTSLQTQRDLGEMFRAGKIGMPIIVSHGVLDTDGSPSWRDTPPETMKLVKESGGVFGVMFAPIYWDKPLAGIAGIVDQIEKAINIVGIDHVALGSDADGFVMLPMKNMGNVAMIVREMEQRGFSREDIEKICYRNFLNTLATRERVIARRKKEAVEALENIQLPESTMPLTVTLKVSQIERDK